MVAAAKRLALVATCGLGLEGLLEAELRGLGATGVQGGRGAVRFRGNWEDCWRANWRLRTANRVLVELGEWPAPDDGKLSQGARDLLELGRGSAPGISCRELLVPDRTFALRATVHRSRIRDLRWAALRVKDGIVDAQRELWGQRASVSRDSPDLPLRLRLDRDRATLLLDSSGEPLDRRGYRLEGGEAPVREQLAAACVLASGWPGTGPVVDPMCGSGTLLAEAGWLALGRPPGCLRRRWAFMGFPGFRAQGFDRLRAEPLAAPGPELRIYGNDRAAETVDLARRNLERAGLGDRARWSQQDLRKLSRPPGPPGLLVVNPPHGGRIEEDRETTQALGALLREHFGGWSAVALVGESRQARDLGVAVLRTLPVRNGPLDARILVLAP